MCADDPSTTAKDGKYHGKFWFTVGGKIESGETIIQAAIRELYEETGLEHKDVEFGPVVWFGEVELVLSGVLTLILTGRYPNEPIAVDLARRPT